VKALFKKAKESQSDLHIEMLNYRATPLTDSDNSPAELLFSRRLWTKPPVTVDKLVPPVGESGLSSGEVSRPILKTHSGRRVSRPLRFATAEKGGVMSAATQLDSVDS